MAACSGAAMLKVLNWCTLRSSRREQRRRDAVADAPARDVQRLAERVHGEAALLELRVVDDGLVHAAVVLHVLVDLVGEHEDGPIARLEEMAASSSRSAALATVQAGLCGLLMTMRRVRSLTAARTRCPVVAEMRRLERDVDAAPAGEPHRRVVGVVGRVEDDGLGARRHDRLDGGVDRFGAAAGDRELGLRVDATAAGGDDLGGDGGAQGDVALHGRVLVVSRGHRFGDAGGQAWIYLVVGKALAYVDRALFGRAARHHGEDRGADVGKFAVEPCRKNSSTKCTAAAHPRTRRLHRTPSYFLARFALRASFS